MILLAMARSVSGGFQDTPNTGTLMPVSLERLPSNFIVAFILSPSSIWPPRAVVHRPPRPRRAVEVVAPGGYDCASTA